MAFKKDEVHVKEYSRRTKSTAIIISLVVIFVLAFLTWYSFVYLNPFITLLVLIVLLIVAAAIIFFADSTLYREIS